MKRGDYRILALFYLYALGLFLFWLFNVPVPQVFATATSITTKGIVQVTATSGTFSATCGGCIEIIAAARSGSTTAPTLPSGWTTITTKNQASGTTAAVRYGCKVASSSGDTGTGTWTNATALVGRSYFGVKHDVTADCNSVAIGGTATNAAAASTTANFPTITMSSTDSTSYVAGFLYDSASSIATPSGMTQFAVSGTSAGNDTNGGVSSWASTNATVSSSTWITGVFELKSIAPIPTAYVIDRWAGVNTSGNPVSSYAGSKNNPTLSGNALIVKTLWADATSVVGAMTDENSDTYTKVIQLDSNSNTITIWCSMPTTGTLHPKITFSGGVGTTTNVDMEITEIKGITNCTNDGTTSAGSIFSGAVSAGSFTPTTNNDILIQFSADVGNIPPTAWMSGASPWALLMVDRVPGGNGLGADVASQIQLQTTAAAINPTMYNGAVNTAITVAAAFKTSATGTAPTRTPRIVASENQYGSTATGSWTTQLPTISGDMIGWYTLNSPTCTLASISDLGGYGNTWTQRGSAVQDSGADSGILQSFDTGTSTVGGEDYNVTSSSCTNSGGGASNWTVIEVTGSGSFDNRQSNQGNNGSAGNFNGPAVTPAHPNGIIIWQEGNVSNSITGIAANGTFICAVPNPFASTNDPQCDNNGFGTFNNSGTSSVTVSWTPSAATGGFASTGTSYNNAVVQPVPRRGAGIVQLLFPNQPMIWRLLERVP